MFLSDVKKESPALFYTILAVMVCFTFTLRHAQSQNYTIAPFVNWDMYSRNLWQQEYYTVFEIRYNGNKRLNMRSPLQELRKESVYTPLDVYNRIREEGLFNHLDTERIRNFAPYIRDAQKSNLFNSHEAVAQFESWFKARLGKITGEAIQSVAVYKVKIDFQSNKIRVIDTPELMFSK